MNTIFIGDIDEYFCDAVGGDKRWAVWLSGKGEKLLGRFETYEEALEYRDQYVEDNK